MRITFFLTCLIVTFGFNGKTQQAPLYNQYQVAPLIYNPSYTGFNDGVHVALFRNEKWGNYDGGFVANSLSVGTLLKDNKSGIGISLYNETVNITGKLNAHLLYSYKIKLGDKSYLRAGIAAGIVDNRIDFSSAVVTDPNDPVIIATLGDRKTFFDLNVGLNFSYADFRVGVSSPQVLGTKLIYSDINSSFYTLERQLVGNLGYSWYINRDKGILLNPEALVIYSFPGAPLQYNTNLIFEMEKIGWLGVGYKSDYAVSFNLGINLIKNLKFGIAYDFQITSIASNNARPNGEILLKYSIPPKIQEIQDNSEYERLLAEQQARMDSLNRVLRDNEREANAKIKFLEDSLAQWPKSVPVVDSIPKVVSNDIKNNSDDYFIELSGKDTPNGYYVITGAFAEKSNADALLRKIKGKFPNARIIINKRNNLYYVMLYHSDEKGEGLAYASYKAKTGLVEETWILHYNRQP